MTVKKYEGNATGWVHGVSYDFKLDFNIIAGKFSILVKEGATTLWDTTITDSTFTAGQFGFDNYSQRNVKYAGFEQQGGVIVDTPEPGILSLFGLGLLGLYGIRRRQIS